MRFALTDEHRGFAEALDDLLGKAEVPAISRRWADGDLAGGLDLWRRLAEVGLTALRVPEEHGGLSAGPVDVVVAFEALGRHLAPGPYIESVVLAPALLTAAGNASPALPALEGLADGTTIVTVAAPPATPFALDADAAQAVLLLDDTALSSAVTGEPRVSVERSGCVSIRSATISTPPGVRVSVDRSRRLFEILPGEELARLDTAVVAEALDTAVLACSAQLLGAGERVLATSVEYAKSRRQFGRVIGEYQALKHALADVRVALDFARPLVYGAAVSLAAGSADAPRDVSAAKVATSEAAYLASRTALQTHGAIGYTEEYDLGLWITKIRALTTAWGTPAFHRDRVLTAITAATA